MMWPSMTENFISLGEASKLYKVSRRTIERLLKRGDLPYHRVGKQIRLLPSDLQSATCRRNSTVTAGNRAASLVSTGSKAVS
jgi:excisionase family DNA binding protein